MYLLPDTLLMIIEPKDFIYYEKYDESDQHA